MTLIIIKINYNKKWEHESMKFVPWGLGSPEEDNYHV